MRKNETGLGLRSLISIHNKQGAVGHVQYALNLATKVGMPRGVYNIDFDPLVVNGNVFRQDGDAALALLIIAVQDALFHLLICAKYSRCI